MSRAWHLAALALAVALAGCKPSIGDQCVLSTDCSTQGDRLCDTSQPGGYCTEFNCTDYSCPDQALCVMFNAKLSGCDYDDRSGAYGARTARSFCVAKCTSDSDCRGGYVCADPKSAPWSGVVLDDDKSRRGCLVPPPGSDVDAAIMSIPPPPVCSAVWDAGGPIDIEAGAPSDGGRPPFVVDAGAADASDAGADAGDADAGDADAGDGG